MDLGPRHNRRALEAAVPIIVASQADMPAEPKIILIKEEFDQNPNIRANHDNDREEGGLSDSNDKSTSIGFHSTMRSNMEKRFIPVSIEEMSTNERPTQNQDAQNQNEIEPDCSLVSTGSFHSGNLNATSENVNGAKNDKSSTPRNIGGEETIEALNQIDLDDLPIPIFSILLRSYGI